MGSSYYASNGSLNYGMAITNSGNPGLKWETTYQYDVGLDLDLFKSRISLTADYYLKDTRDMCTMPVFPRSRVIRSSGKISVA